MRQLTSAAQALIQQRVGLEPVTIVQVAWDGAQFVSYADKDFAGVPGRVISVGNLDDVRNLAGSGSSAQVSVVLDDVDGTIKAIMDQRDVQKVPVRILQCFTGLTLADAFLIFQGGLVSPISWSEGDRSVSFEAITLVEAGGFGLYSGTSGEVGFSPEESQFPSVSPKLWGRTWPLALGDVVHVPAVQSFEKLRGATATGIGIPDYTLPLKYWALVERLSVLAGGFNYYLTLVNALRELIGTAPVDLSGLFTNFDFEHLKDAASSVDQLDIDQVTVNKTGEDATGNLNYLDRIVIPQLFAGMPNVTALDLDTAIQVVNQMELSYSQLIWTEQRAKQDHEDAAAVVLVFDKVSDKFQQVLQLDTGDVSDYVDAVNGMAAYVQAVIDSRTSQTTVFVGKEVVQPTSQSQLFQLQAPPDAESSPIMQLLFQVLSNLVASLRDLAAQLAAATTVDQWKSLTKAVSDQVTATGNQQKVLVNSLTQTLIRIQGAKERLEVDMSNVEYAYKTIREIDQKIWKVIRDYHKTLKEVWKVQRAIRDQANIPRTSVLLATNHNFPQGAVRLNINDMVFSGTLAGNTFTPSQIEPKYFGVPVGPRVTDEMDCFWVTDPTYILKGCYCLKAFVVGPDDPDFDPADPLNVVRWRIFRVKEQYGTKCVIELVENRDRLAPRSPKQSPPVLQDLPADLEAVFEGAKAHTRQEVVRILENSLEKYETHRLEQLKQSVEKLSALYSEATTDDEAAVIRETVTKDVNEYNARVSKLRFKAEAVKECLKTITDHERSQLIKLENLKIAMGLTGVDNTPTQIPAATRLYYITGYDVTDRIYAVSRTMLPSWFQFSPGGEELVDNETIIRLPDHQAIRADYLPLSSFWYAPPGSECDLVDANAEVYIANILPSSVKGVYGKVAVNGVLQLVPLARNMYVLNEADTSYAPLTVTSVTLRQPLTAYNVGFDKQVYVSLSSSVHGNAADIIRWVVEHWTNLTCDGASFAAASAALTNYPTNFCLLQKRDAMKLIEQVAWESRCAVWVKNQVVYIMYLAQEPTPVDVITESDVEEGTLGYELTHTEDLVTKLVASWKSDYAMPEANETVVRYNIPKYGLWERRYNFETLNIGSLVLKSLTFWSMRYSNSWKRVKFRTFLHKLALETWDWVTLDFQQPYFSDGPVSALVERADYDSEHSAVTVQCWLPVRSGEMTEYQFAFPAGLSAQVIYPPLEDVVLGLAGNYQNSAVPNNVPFHIQPNQNLLEAMRLAPKDYGGITPSDAADGLPPSPLVGLVLTDYVFNLDVQDHNMPNYPRAKTELEGRPGVGFTPSVTGDIALQLGNNDKLGPPAPTPMREVFHGRVVRALDQAAGTYLVQASDGRSYTVEQRGGAAGPLGQNQVVTAVRDDALGRYTMNEQPASESGAIVTYLGEVTATSGAGVQPSYQVKIFGNTYSSTQGPTADFPTFPNVGVRTVYQVGTTLPFFNGELVAINQISGVWQIQKLTDSSLAGVFSVGQVSFRAAYVADGKNQETTLTIPGTIYYETQFATNIAPNGAQAIVRSPVQHQLYDAYVEYIDVYSVLYSQGQCQVVTGLLSGAGLATPAAFYRTYNVPVLGRATDFWITPMIQNWASTISTYLPLMRVNGSGGGTFGFAVGGAPGSTVDPSTYTVSASASLTSSTPPDNPPSTLTYRPGIGSPSTIYLDDPGGVPLGAASCGYSFTILIVSVTRESQNPNVVNAGLVVGLWYIAAFNWSVGGNYYSMPDGLGIQWAITAVSKNVQLSVKGVSADYSNIRSSSSSDGSTVTST